MNKDKIDTNYIASTVEDKKRIAQLEEEIAILHEAGGIDAKERDHLREVIQERNKQIDELTKRVEHEASKFAVAFAAKCKAEKDRDYFDERLQKQIEATLKLDKENAELEAENEANKNGAKKYAEFYFQTNEKLTKATELIRGLLSCLYSVEYDRVSDLEEAEQFLSEVEK